MDLLTPCTILSKVMQSDDLDILGVLSSLLRSVKEVDKSSYLDRWPTYAATLLTCMCWQSMFLQLQIPLSPVIDMIWLHCIFLHLGLLFKGEQLH